MDSRTDPKGLPDDETEIDASLTPTDATTDPVEAAEAARRIESDAGLSGALGQGAGALGVGGRRARDRTPGE